MTAKSEKLKFKNLTGDLFFASPVEELKSLVDQQEHLRQTGSLSIALPNTSFYIYRATTQAASLKELIDILESDLQKLKSE